MGQYTIWCFPQIMDDENFADDRDETLPDGYFQGFSPHLGKVSVFKTVVKKKSSKYYGKEVIVVELAKGRKLLKDRKQIKSAVTEVSVLTVKKKGDAT